MIRLGLVGCGHWGPNYLRIFDSLDETKILIVCDRDPAALEKTCKRYPEVQTTTEFDRLLEKEGLEAVIIASPADTHFDYTKKALRAGKHVLVEKPLALTVEACRELCELAQSAKKILMVGHTFLYNPAIRKMKEMVDRGEAGQIYYLQAVRTHLGLIRNDVNTVWDLSPHDISIFSYLLDKDVKRVSAVGISPLEQGLEDVAFVNLFYDGAVMGNIHLSWVDANKSRQVAVIGSKARILFDDLNPLERIRIYQKGVSIEKKYQTFGQFQLLLRDGDIISPRIEPEEPLFNLCREFVACVETGRKPLTDGWNGLKVVEVMCAVQESIRQGGRPVELGIPV